MPGRPSPYWAKIEDLFALATSGYLAAEDSASLVQEALREVEEVRRSIHKGSLDNGTLERLDAAEEQLGNFSGEPNMQRFTNMTSSEADIYQRGVWSFGDSRVITGCRQGVDRNGVFRSVDGSANRFRPKPRTEDWEPLPGPAGSGRYRRAAIEVVPDSVDSRGRGKEWRQKTVIS